MAAYYDVKVELKGIADAIRKAQRTYDQAKATISQVSADLGAIPTTYADVIATINAYAPTGSITDVSDPAQQDLVRQANAKAEKAELQSEFQALKATVDALIATVEFSA